MRNDDIFAGTFLVIMLIAVAVAIVLGILFLMTLMKCLQRVSPHNRDMEPGMVFLNLIPCVNIVWMFITVTKIGSSVQKEYYDRGLRDPGDGFGVGVGITFQICNLISWIPYIGVIFSLVGLVCWIIYWVKVAGYSGQLAASEGGSRSRRLRDEDDDFDKLDRPRKHRDYDDDFDRRAGDGEPDDRFTE